MTTKSDSPNGYVLVTTKHRGVFCGRLVEDNGPTYVKLENARCAIRFGTSKGFLELAETGPTSRSKIGSPAPEITLYDVTSVTSVSKPAEEAWLKS